MMAIRRGRMGNHEIDSGSAQGLVIRVREDDLNLVRSGKGVRFVGAVREESDAPSEPVVEAVLESIKPRLANPEGPSIAVLPLTNMSGDSEQDYFADGMAEEVITALSRCSGLFVIARNSSFTYKGKAVDIRQVGRELGVGYVLEGSVRRGGERLRISGQLINATSGAHLWADRFRW